MLQREVLERVASAALPGSSIRSIAPLRGGLESVVVRITVTSASGTRTMIVKRLRGAHRREAERYRVLAGAGVTPRLLGVAEDGDDTFLVLEQLRPAVRWPWRDSRKSLLVLEHLARVHTLTHELPRLQEWRYEEDLEQSAAETVRVVRSSGLTSADFGGRAGALRRVAALLPEARKQMFAVLGTTLIHGDVHSGNVMMLGTEERPRMVLLDWARSRAGSPLEDVASWLQSLRPWEPAAARDHDSLFRAYLAAAGLSTVLTRELRSAYWVAAVSNVLAGALRHHLVAARTSSGSARRKSLLQVRDALRVIRRADESLRSL